MTILTPQFKLNTGASIPALGKGVTHIDPTPTTFHEGLPLAID
jgi:hypothetical protein